MKKILLVIMSFVLLSSLVLFSSCAEKSAFEKISDNLNDLGYEKKDDSHAASYFENIVTTMSQAGGIVTQEILEEILSEAKLHLWETDYYSVLVLECNSDDVMSKMLFGVPGEDLSSYKKSGKILGNCLIFSNDSSIYDIIKAL